MPSPPCERSSVRSSWVNISNTRGSICGGMPLPSSRTTTSTSPPWRSATTRIWPPGSVYFTELLIRLVNTCTSRVASASRYTGVGGSERSTRWRLASTSGWLASIAVRSTWPNSTCWRRSSSLLRVIRLTSIRSSTSRTMCRICRSITATTSIACGLAPSRRLSSSTPLRIGASGLRSSCASVARNSSLRLSASDRSRAILRRLSSSSLRSLMSAITPIRWVAAPPSNRNSPAISTQRHSSGARRIRNTTWKRSPGCIACCSRACTSLTSSGCRWRSMKVAIESFSSSGVRPKMR